MNGFGFSPQDLADCIILQCIEDGVLISNIHLQKIVFFLDVVYCNDTGGLLLFDEEFEAMPLGPTMWSAYKDYKSYGGKPIKQVRANSTPDILNQLKSSPFGNYIISGIRALRNIYYGELLDLSQIEGSPWDTVYNKEGHQNQAIPNDSIRSYYSVSHIAGIPNPEQRQEGYIPKVFGEAGGIFEKGELRFDFTPPEGKGGQEPQPSPEIRELQAMVLESQDALARQEEQISNFNEKMSNFDEKMSNTDEKMSNFDEKMSNTDEKMSNFNKTLQEQAEASHKQYEDLITAVNKISEEAADQAKRIDGQIDQQNDRIEGLKEQSEQLKGTYQRAQNDYIAILGVFSAIVMTFVGGTSYVEANLVDLVAMPPTNLLKIVFGLGIVLVLLLYLAFWFIWRLVNRDIDLSAKGGPALPSFMSGKTLVLFSIIFILVVAFFIFLMLKTA